MPAEAMSRGASLLWTITASCSGAPGCHDPVTHRLKACGPCKGCGYSAGIVGPIPLAGYCDGHALQPYGFSCPMCYEIPMPMDLDPIREGAP